MNRPFVLGVAVVSAAATVLIGCVASSPAGQCTIYTDVYGVPHIYGPTEYDVLFGMGYAMARDQLPTMVKMYRTAKGRLAAYDGPGEGYGNVALDYFTHLFRIPQSAAQAYERMPERERAWLTGFADGVNAYIREHNRTASPNIEYFSPVDVAAWGLYTSFAEQFPHAVAELREQVDLDLKIGGTLLCDLVLPASNQWAVSEARTGGPVMIFGDPHLTWRGPHQWYEVHLRVTDGSLNVTGAAAVGTPFVAIGRNEHVAWTLTSNTPSLDFADVYKEKLVRRYSLSEYRYDPAPGSKKPIVGRMLALSIKDFPLPVWLPMYYTHHGPIMPLGLKGFLPEFTQDGEHVYSIAMSVMDNRPDAYPGGHISGLLRLFYRLNTARTVRDIELALGLQGVPGAYPSDEALQLSKWNIVAGDTQGNILFQYNGRCPIRVSPRYEDPHFYRRPIPGWDGSSEWQRDAEGRTLCWPLADLPRVINPACGYLVNCNVSPWRVCPASGIDPDAYPPYLVSDETTDRQARALDLVENAPMVTEENLRRFALDVHILAADVFENLLFSFYDPEVYPDLAAVADLLAAEPNEAVQENRSVLLLHRWLDAIVATKTQFPRDPADLTGEQKSLLIETLRTARDELLACPWGFAPPWGEVHRISLGQDSSIPMDGGTGPINTLFQVFGLYEPCRTIIADAGSSFLQVTVLDADCVVSRAARPIGASGDSGSPHYNDETLRFAARDPNVTFRPSVFTDEEVTELYVESVTQFGEERYP